MANSLINLNPGSGGQALVSDKIGTGHYIYTKMTTGAEGEALPVTSENPVPVRTAPVPPENLLFRYLDTNGDGTGTKDATGDYSGAEEEFFIKPGASEAFLVSDIRLAILDASGWNIENYGKLAALTNGVRLEVRDDSGLVLDLLDGIPVTTNGGLVVVSDLVETIEKSANKELWHVSFLLPAPLLIDGALGRKLVVTLNDNFTDIDSQFFLVQGIKA